MVEAKLRECLKDRYGSNFPVAATAKSRHRRGGQPYLRFMGSKRSSRRKRIESRISRIEAALLAAWTRQGRQGRKELLPGTPEYHSQMLFLAEYLSEEELSGLESPPRQAT
jgi:hypothetical protein